MASNVNALIATGITPPQVETMQQAAQRGLSVASLGQQIKTQQIQNQIGQIDLQQKQLDMRDQATIRQLLGLAATTPQGGGQPQGPQPAPLATASNGRPTLMTPPNQNPGQNTLGGTVNQQAATMPDGLINRTGQPVDGTPSLPSGPGAPAAQAPAGAAPLSGPPRGQALDLGAFADSLAGKVQPKTQLALKTMATDLQKKTGDILETKGKIAQQESDLIAALAHNVQKTADPETGDYDPTAWDGGLSMIEARSPEYAAHIEPLRQAIAQNPRVLNQLVDQSASLASHDVVKGWASESEANTGAQKAGREQEEFNIKKPGLEAEAGILQNKLKQITNADPAAFSQLVNNVAPKDKNPALNLRTQGLVNFALQRGDVEGAKAAVTAAATEVGALERATDPRVQQNKINLTVANTEARGAAQIQASGMTADDFARAGEQYARTGVMPALGRDSATRGAIVHAGMEWARDNGFSQGNLVSMQAAYSGDKESLKKFQSQRDQIVSFENTAGKNLDLFLQQAAKIPDTGVPWLNTPVRLLSQQIVGSTNMAAINAARQVANNEIAKVTSGGGLSGVLSDSARHEVAGFNPQNATLPQIVAIAKVLKQDMANRHQAMDATLGDIKGRLGGTGGGAAAPKASKRYNPTTGKIEDVQ